jgi:hypothetical protein
MGSPSVKKGCGSCPLWKSQSFRRTRRWRWRWNFRRPPGGRQENMGSIDTITFHDDLLLRQREANREQSCDHRAWDRLAHRSRLCCYQRETKRCIPMLGRLSPLRDTEQAREGECLALPLLPMCPPLPRSQRRLRRTVALQPPIAGPRWILFPNRIVTGQRTSQFNFPYARGNVSSSGLMIPRFMRS